MADAAIRDYKDLAVWQRSMALVGAAYALAAGFPTAERFGLAAQMCRAAVSVPSNIAEGWGRQATGEYRHHCSIARGSLLEFETLLLLALQQGFAQQAAIDPLLGEVEQLSRMLATLVGRLRR